MFRIAAFVIAMAGVSPLLAHDVGEHEHKEEFQAQAVEVLNDSAEMFYHADYWITVTSGTYGKEGIPRLIRRGDAITVGDRTLVANYIYAERCIKPLADDGEVVCVEGHADCVIVERPEDYPMADGSDRVWIYVKDCRPSE